MSAGTGRRGRVVVAIVAAVLLTTVGAEQVTPASAQGAPAAAPPWAGFRIPATGSADSGWIGARKLGKQSVVYRIQPRQRAVATSYSRPRSVRDLGGPTAGPSRRATRLAAFVLANYGTRRVAVQAAGVDAAAYHLLAGGEHRLSQERARRRIGATGRPAATVYAYAKASIAQAKKLAGPYRITVDATPSEGGSPSTVTVSVRSAAGRGLPDVPVRLRYPGLSSKPRRTDEAGRVVVEVTPAAAGVSTITAQVSRLPHWKLFVRRAQHPRASDVAVAGRLARRTVRGSIQASGQQVVRITNAAPTQRTSAPMAGIFTLSGGTGSREVTSSAYGPFASAAAAGSAGCRGPASSVTETITGNGDFPLPRFVPQTSGYYRWGVAAAGNEDSLPGSACGTPVRVQTTSRTGQDRPGGAAKQVAVGEGFRVQVDVSGFDRVEPGHVLVSRLFGPFADPGSISCAGSAAKSVDRVVSDNGSYAMPKVTITKQSNAGWYAWRSELRSGDLVLGSTSSCGVRYEVG